jgi:hypothetical protein
MPHKFTEIAFTPAVKALQTRNGSRASYARFETTGPDNNRVTPEIAAFIQQRDSFYLGTVSANGYAIDPFEEMKECMVIEPQNANDQETSDIAENMRTRVNQGRHGH